MTDGDDRPAGSGRGTRPDRNLDAAAPSRRKKGPRCPICGAATVQQHRPFCSRRCADIDLGRWLGEHYRVPGEPAAQTPEKEDNEGGD